MTCDGEGTGFSEAHPPAQRDVVLARLTAGTESIGDGEDEHEDASNCAALRAA